MLACIPLELRAYNQFVLWRYEDKVDGKKPTKVPYGANGYHASVTNPQTWCNYETALNALDNGDYAGIGFVLTENDPFALIDLDDPFDESKGYSQEEAQALLDRQVKIHMMFDSYSERSPSGKGLHILCKGAIPQGRKRGQIEIYSSVRFMTLTGDVFNDKPMEERGELLNVLWSEMGADVKVYTTIGDRPQFKTDDEICDIAAAAMNGHKFVDLYRGNWYVYYSSQSEADFALIDIVAFYTQNREQIARIFRNSALGNRDKAFREDYVSFMINRSFDHQLPPIDIEGLKIQVEAAMLAKQAAAVSQTVYEPVTASDMPYSYDSQPASDMQPEQPPLTQNYNEPTPEVLITSPSTARVYPKPPGLLGDIADFIYAAAIRPVPEIALAGAIGLMSGICGRAYNVSATGLNQYTLLIAPTGTGKEAMSGGIDRLMAAIQPFTPQGEMFIGPGQISSEQALAKHFHRHSKSFVAITGEIGIWLQMICSPFAGPHQTGIKRAMLDLYNKSGRGNVYKATINSDKEKSTDATNAPAFSILGESTPEEFYKILDDSMISSGLLPRFSIVEYRGKRVRKNPRAKDAYPSDGLIKSLSVVCINAVSLNEQNQVINVGYTPDAEQLLNSWDTFCDDEMNAEKTESGEIKKQLWNRGHMKALKLAALVAVGCNAYEPRIDWEVANWAINIVHADIMNILNRFAAGEIGTDTAESKQMLEIQRCVKDYVTLPFSSIEQYHAHSGLHAERIVSFSYLSRRLAATACFKQDKQGATTAIKRAVQTLQDRGDLVEVPRGDLNRQFGTTARAFAILNAKAFGI